MRILFLLHSTGQYEGSIRSFLNLCLGLRKFDIEPYVICPNREGIYNDLTVNNISTFVIPTKPNVWPKKTNCMDYVLYIPRLMRMWGYNFIGYHKIKRICKDIKPHIIHTNVGIINVGFRVAQGLRIPHIYHLREYQDKDFNYKIRPSRTEFIKSLFNKHSYAIAITKNIKNYFGENNEHIKVVYNGILKELPEIDYIPVRDRKYFLYAGRIEKNKGIEECLQAFAEFCRTNVDMELWIAGDTSIKMYKEQIHDLVHNLQITDKVKFLGMRKDINQLMRKAKAYIMSSFFEGFGRTTAEAMTNNCLVIGKNCGGTKEQFDNGLDLNQSEIGLRYDGVLGLSKQMTIVDKMSDDEYKEIIERARLTVENLYTNDKYIKEIIKIYNTISK